MMNNYLKFIVGLFFFSTFMTSCEPEQLPADQAKIKTDVIHPVGSGNEQNSTDHRDESDT